MPAPALLLEDAVPQLQQAAQRLSTDYLPAVTTSADVIALYREMDALRDAVLSVVRVKLADLRSSVGFPFDDADCVSRLEEAFTDGLIGPLSAAVEDCDDGGFFDPHAEHRLSASDYGLRTGRAA